MRPLIVAVVILVLIAAIIVGVVYLLDRRQATETESVDHSAPAGSTSGDRQPSTPPALPVAAAVVFRPTLRGRDLQVLRTDPYFVVGYDNQRKNPAWVSYDLSGPITHPGPEPTRPPTFQTDFKTSAHVSHRDYSNSGFERGHMCPAYAMWSRHGQEGFTATFICSNIIPQPHAVNAGIWEDLEVAIAGRPGAGGGWAERLGAVTVINGPVYGASTEHLRAGVTVPSACFSIVVDRHHQPIRAIAFEIPNVAGTTGPLGRWITTIERIERDTGLDVFVGEAEALRSVLETARAERVW